LPLIYLTGLRAPVVDAKMLWVIIASAALMFFWLARIVLDRSVCIRSSLLDIAFICVVAATLVSGFLSLLPYQSFVGRPSTGGLSVFFVLALIVFAWITIQETVSVRQWHMLWTVVFAATGLSALVFLFGQFDVTQGFLASLPFGLPPSNLIGLRASELAMFTALVGLVGAGMLMHKEKHWWMQLLPALAFLLSAAVLVRVGFAFAIALFAGGLVLLVLVGWFQAPRMRLWVIAILSLFAVASIFFAVQGIPAGVKVKLAPEITLSPNASWFIAKSTLGSGTESFLLGVGPGTFDAAFALYRPVQFAGPIDTQAPAFIRPYNTFFSFAAEFGFLFSLSFLLCIVLVFIIATHAFLELSSETKLYNAFSREKLYRDTSRRNHFQVDGIVVGVAWVVATLGMAVYTYGPALWWLWWFLTAMTVVGLASLAPKQLRSVVKDIRITSYSAVIITVILVLLTIGIGMGGLAVSNMVRAERAYAQAAAVSPAAAQEKIEEALLFAPKNLEYRLSLAQGYLEQARLQSLNPSDPERLGSALAAATDHALKAAKEYPGSKDAWQTLAILYMNARGLVDDENAKQANARAAEALEHAVTLDPYNPRLHWQMGLVKDYSDDVIQAAESYNGAIALRADFIAAYQSLAALYERHNQIDKAVAVYQQMVDKNIEPARALYEQGRLVFNRNKGDDITRAEQLWLSAIEKDPTYANALYSLGLLYERLGNRAEALTYFRRVQSLNPFNEDVKDKIQSLQ